MISVAAKIGGEVIGMAVVVPLKYQVLYDRYRALEQFTEDAGDTPTDGAELTLFVWREFCERADLPPIQGLSASKVIAILRQTIQLS